MESTQSILITDIYIVKYFEENPQLNPTKVFAIFIELLKQLSTDLNSAVNNAAISQLLTRITEVNTSVATFKNDVHTTVRDQTNLLENIILKDRERIGGIITDKTASAFTQANTHIQTVLLDVQDKNKNNLQQYNTELKQLLRTTDEQTQTEIRSLRTQLTEQMRINESLNTELHTFLNKYKNNSSVKGNISEKELYGVLQQLFPTDELVVCARTTASCDICVNRAEPTKPSILFENKDYAVSVDREEIKKFERDLHTQRKHGVFISQNSPITFKSNFHIDIIDGLIHVYLPNAGYDADRIRVAVDIIDHLSNKLALDTEADREVGICKTELDEILAEYKNFATRKMGLMDSIKNTSKMWTEELEAMAMPRIHTLLTHTGRIEKSELTCVYCLTFTGRNKASISAHMKGCKSNPKAK